MAKYRWYAMSEDKNYEEDSKKAFDTEKECYEDMRNAAFEKAKWNTQYDEDFTDVDFPEYEVTIGYRFSFGRKRILHSSYSGRYAFVMYEEGKKPTEEEMMKYFDGIELM